MNKSIKIVIGIIITIIIIWGIIFTIDYYRCSNMKEPIFTISKQENDLSIKSVTHHRRYLKKCLGKDTRIL